MFQIPAKSFKEYVIYLNYNNLVIRYFFFFFLQMKTLGSKEGKKAA